MENPDDPKKKSSLSIPLWILIVVIIVATMVILYYVIPYFFKKYLHQSNTAKNGIAMMEYEYESELPYNLLGNNQPQRSTNITSITNTASITVEDLDFIKTLDNLTETLNDYTNTLSSYLSEIHKSDCDNNEDDVAQLRPFVELVKKVKDLYRLATIENVGFENYNTIKKLIAGRNLETKIEVNLIKFNNCLTQFKELINE